MKIWDFTLIHKLLICCSNNRIPSRRCQLAVEQAKCLGEKGTRQLT